MLAARITTPGVAGLALVAQTGTAPPHRSRSVRITSCGADGVQDLGRLRLKPARPRPLTPSANSASVPGSGTPVLA
jgi:hypothetical protein